MSLSYITNSTVPTAAGTGTAGGGTSPLTLTPPAHNAGDMLLAWVASKPETAGASPTPPSGWTLVPNSEAAGGGGTTGADTGPTRAGWYYKVGDGDTTPVDWTYTAGNCRMGMICVVRSDVGGATFEVAGANGIDSTTGATFTAAMGTDPGIDANDMVLVYGGIPTDVTTPAQFSNQTLTATGLTSGSATEIAEPETTQGNDLGGVLTRWSPTGGPSSGVATFSADAAGTTTNVRGPIVLVRVREVAPVVSLQRRNVVPGRPRPVARRGPTIVRAPSTPTATPLVRDRTRATDNAGPRARYARTRAARHAPLIRRAMIVPPVPEVRPEPIATDNAARRSMQVRTRAQRHRPTVVGRRAPNPAPYFRPRILDSTGPRRAAQTRARAHHRERPVILRAVVVPPPPFIRPKIIARDQSARALGTRAFARRPVNYARARSVPTATPLVRDRTLTPGAARRRVRVRAFHHHREHGISVRQFGGLIGVEPPVGRFITADFAGAAGRTSAGALGAAAGRGSGSSFTAGSGRGAGGSFTSGSGRGSGGTFGSSDDRDDEGAFS